MHIYQLYEQNGKQSFLISTTSSECDTNSSDFMDMLRHLINYRIIILLLLLPC